MPKPNVDIVQGAFEAKSFSVAACEHGSIFIRLHDRAGKVFAFACFDKGTGLAAVAELEACISGGASFKCESVH